MAYPWRCSRCGTIQPQAPSFVADGASAAQVIHAAHARQPMTIAGVPYAPQDTTYAREVVLPADEVVLPPRGYCIGVFGHGQGDGIIGPFATEAQARDALANAVICAVGGPYGWHQQQ